MIHACVSFRSFSVVGSLTSCVAAINAEVEDSQMIDHLRSQWEELIGGPFKLPIAPATATTMDEDGVYVAVYMVTDPLTSKPPLIEIIFRGNSIGLSLGFFSFCIMRISWIKL